MTAIPCKFANDFRKTDARIAALHCSLCSNVGCQHLGKFVILQTSFQKFFFRQTSIIVFVHSVENILCSLFCRVGGFDSPCPQHVVDGLHNLGHLVLVNHSISVHIVHSESPFELFLGGPRGCHVDG